MRADTEKLAGREVTAAYGSDPRGGIGLNPVLEIKNLNYIYSVGTPFEHKALDNVNFSVNRGEFIGIIGGSLIVEKAFQIPGVGKMYLESITALDYNLYMLLNCFYTLIGLLSGIVVDLSYGFVDPRIRMGEK